jgi:hypothetical protein
LTRLTCDLRREHVSDARWHPISALVAALTKAGCGSSNTIRVTRKLLKGGAPFTRPEGRSKLPHCVPFHAGVFGMPRDCVAQCEAIYALEKGEIDIVSGVLGRLDATRLRDTIKAIGDVIDSDCEPN